MGSPPAYAASSYLRIDPWINPIGLLVMKYTKEKNKEK